MGYVEPEAKMQNKGLMSTKIRAFKYGEGVLARSARSGHLDILAGNRYEVVCRHEIITTPLLTSWGDAFVLLNTVHSSGKL